jgi:hypothetical protein
MKALLWIAIIFFVFWICFWAIVKVIGVIFWILLGLGCVFLLFYIFSRAKGITET